jgi:putative two-component system response regulator
MKAHTTLGADMLSGAGFALLEMAETIAMSHHERWDGTGYPAGIAGDAIPRVGRIVAIADVFDALTHQRPYKEAWTVEAAVAEISGQSGRQFDPEMVDAFLQVVPDHEPHTEVEGVKLSRSLPAGWRSGGAAPPPAPAAPFA